jgi:hypothetical protein
MGRLLEKIYQKLPIIREIRQIHQEITRFNEHLYWTLRPIRRIHQSAYHQHLMSQERYRDPKRLFLYEHQIHSQHGEDGTIAEIFRRIGTTNRTFVEVGVGNGLENNTAYLLTQGWTGCWVEGDPQGVQAIRDNLGRRLSDGTLKLIELFVTMENIGPALKACAVPEDVDLLSIDVDLNTYWIWSALAQIHARAVVVEYNSTFPASVDWKVEYHATAQWDGSFHYGASLKAFELLGRQLGYCVVGCDLTGANAYFVRQELCQDAFREPFDSETHYEPDRGYLWGLRTTTGHPRGYGDLA